MIYVYKDSKSISTEIVKFFIRLFMVYGEIHLLHVHFQKVNLG